MLAEGQGRRDPPRKPRPEVLQLNIAASPRSVRDGLRQVMLWASAHLGAEDELGSVEIVLAEVLNNIVEHAYKSSGAARAFKASLERSFAGSGAGRVREIEAREAIRLTLTKSAAGLICQVEDRGAAMLCGLPASHAPPDPADLPEGGFGWPLIRALCRDLRYERAGGLNRLQFTLPLRQSGTCDAIV